MSYVDTVDYQARKFGAGATVSLFSLAIAGFFLDLATPPPPPKPVKERALVVFPIPGIEDKRSALKVFDLPKPEKEKPKIQPEKKVTEAPAEKKEASSPQKEEVEKTSEDSFADALALGTPTIWTPPPPKSEKQEIERKEIKKIDLPRVTVNDDRAEKKIDVNRPPRLVEAREQRMDDTEVLDAVRRLQAQLSSSYRPSRPGETPRQTVVEDRIVQEGTVALRFQVKADGSIANCAVAVSSGSDVLDRRACELVSSFVYEAGTDERGQKVEKTMIETIEWLGGDARRGSDGQVVGVPGSAPPARPFPIRQGSTRPGERRAGQ